jgi:hypothetical protein
MLKSFQPVRHAPADIMTDRVAQHSFGLANNDVGLSRRRQDGLHLQDLPQ